MILSILLFLSGCELLGPGYTTKIHGLFIGLDYDNSSIVSSLDGTISDATEMAGAFSRIAEEYGIPFDGYLAIQEGNDPDTSNPLYPRADNILDLIAHIGDVMEESDIFVLYYAGHGGADSTADATSGFIVPAEGSPITAGHSFPVLKVETLAEAIHELPGHQVIILDSCQSGSFVTPYPLSQTEMLERWDPSQFYLTSTQIDEDAYDYFPAGDHGHGYFTLQLLNFFGWEHRNLAAGRNYTTLADFYRTSLSEKDIDVVISGRLPDGWGQNAPGSITLSDLEDAVRALSSQEAKRTSGPRDIILFH